MQDVLSAVLVTLAILDFTHSLTFNSYPVLQSVCADREHFMQDHIAPDAVPMLSPCADSAQIMQGLIQVDVTVKVAEAVQCKIL